MIRSQRIAPFHITSALVGIALTEIDVDTPMWRSLYRQVRRPLYTQFGLPTVLMQEELLHDRFIR